MSTPSKNCWPPFGSWPRAIRNLGLLKFEQGNSQLAQAYVDDALTIRRRLWEKFASAYADDLAESLHVKILILLSKEGETIPMHHHDLEG